MPPKEQWRIDLDNEIKRAKASTKCICDRDKPKGELFCDQCEEEAQHLYRDFLDHELPYVKGVQR